MLCIIIALMSFFPLLLAPITALLVRYGLTTFLAKHKLCTTILAKILGPFPSHNL